MVVGNTYNLYPSQAADADGGGSGHGGNGGNGGFHDGAGDPGGNGGAGGSGPGGSGAAAGSTGAQPIYTGSIAVEGAAFQNFAGILTTSFNTGIGANALSATGVTANSNVSFGHN